MIPQGVEFAPGSTDRDFVPTTIALGKSVRTVEGCGVARLMQVSGKVQKPGEVDCPHRPGLTRVFKHSQRIGYRLGDVH
ncbi:hypothetical protein Spa11_14390 [Botrimarina mediterranea]|uniref:Uncharacterized protein n=1 Tax=Botrimarina mediterranea TaxID=2528022 RepID=A0A518K622_9BACT|nr:hypothetical protein Spa11_14390 [Botrimarina mediterranea]